MSFAGLLASDRILGNEIGSALTSLPFFHIGSDRRTRPQQLAGQQSVDAGRLLKGPTQADYAPRKLKCPFLQVAPWLLGFSLHSSPFTLLPIILLNSASIFAWKSDSMS